MARSHPVAALLLLATAVAGCIGGAPSDAAGGAQAPATLQHLGTWENPDEAIVATNATDVTGDGFDEVFVAQRNGSITALDVNATRTLWQASYGYGLDDVVGVGGERGPALAVVDDAYGYPSSDLTLVAAGNGDVLARRDLGEIRPDRVDAADLNDDGVDDLVVVGTTLRPDDDPHYAFPQTAVVAVDGRFDDEGPLAGTPVDDDRLWRRQIDGYPSDLVAGDDRVHVATDDSVVALDGQGRTVYHQEVDDVRDIAVEGSQSLVLTEKTARWLDADGATIWTRNVTADGHGAAAIGTLGEVRSLVAYGEGNVTVRGFAADGEAVLDVVAGNLTEVADLAVVDVRADVPRAAVAGVTADGHAAVALAGPNGSLVGPVATGRGHAHDRLSTADVHADPGREVVLARHEGYLEYLLPR